MQITRTVCVSVSDEWISCTHAYRWQHSLNIFLFEFIVELILSSKILCTLRCVTFRNSTTSYDKRNACNRYGCWLSLMFMIICLFFQFWKNWPENIVRKKKKASAISNSMMLIRWLWQKSMWPNKIKQSKQNVCSRAKLMALTQKRPTMTNLDAVHRLNWMKIRRLFFSVCEIVCWNRNIWYIYACQRLIILIAHSNHFR